MNGIKKSSLHILKKKKYRRLDFLLKILSENYIYLIFPQKIINLQQVGKHLRTGHQLSIPRGTIIFRVIHKLIECRQI